MKAKKMMPTKVKAKVIKKFKISLPKGKKSKGGWCTGCMTG